VEGWINNSVSTTGGMKTAEIKITSDIPLIIKSCETPDISVDLKKHSKSDFPPVPPHRLIEIKKCSKDMTA
jgi:hypothetical protein